LPSDKTQVFHDQIEVKQKELQPWTAKINSQQAEIDVASSERNALAKKAEAVKAACQEAQESLRNLQADQEAKVRAFALWVFRNIDDIPLLKTAELAKLRANKDNSQKDFRTAEKKLKVRFSYQLCFLQY
jgi:structural maintenance of chromosome 4